MIFLRRILTAVFFVAVLVIGWRFAHENAATVGVSFLAGRVEEVALWLVMLVSCGVGASVVAIYAMFGRARASLIARRYRKTVAALEAEVHQLRNLPVAGDPAESVAVVEPDPAAEFARSGGA